jgi:hypothetical protein
MHRAGDASNPSIHHLVTKLVIARIIYALKALVSNMKLLKMRF